DVQPEVAVDQVVSLHPLDGVAAEAAQQDVAAHESDAFHAGNRGVGQALVEAGGPHQLGQPVDLGGTCCRQLHTHEQAFGHFRRGRIAQHAVGPADLVVEVPPRCTVHEPVLVPEVVEVDR